MQKVTRTWLTAGRKVALSSRSAIGTLAVLLGASLLSQPVAAQVSSQTIATRPPLSPEILAMHARLKRPTATTPRGLELAATAAAPITFNSEQGPGPGPRAGLPGCDVFPAPASIGATVGLSYFGPPPSSGRPRASYLLHFQTPVFVLKCAPRTPVSRRTDPM